MAEPPGLAIFLERCYERLYQAAYRVVRRREEAKDIVQEATIRVWRRAQEKGWEHFGEGVLTGGLLDPRSEGSRRLKGCLRRATIRLALNSRRHEFVVEDVLEMIEKRRPDQPSETPLRGMLRDEACNVVYATLRKLRARESELLLLWMSGCSHERIADELGIRFNSVGPRLRRAQEAFVKLLQHGHSRREAEQLYGEERVSRAHEAGIRDRGSRTPEAPRLPADPG